MNLFLFYFKIKDMKKEYNFKISYWSDGNISVKYKTKKCIHYFDLGFSGTVYSLEDLENNLKIMMEENNE